MTSRTSVNDVQSTRLLAHQLYCHCQNSNSAFRSIAKSVRALRNKLEEADELLSEAATLRPEEIRVLRAADASKEVLDRLEKVLLPTHQSANLHLGVTAQQDIEHFSTWIDLATKELSDSLESLERVTGNIDMLLDTSSRALTPSTTINTPISIASSDQWPALKKHFGSNRASMSDATSIRSSAAGSLSGNNRNIKQRETVLDAQTNTSNSTKTSSSSVYNWSTPFASPDPMSSDIDTASSMILSDVPMPSPEFRSSPYHMRSTSSDATYGQALCEPGAGSRTRDSPLIQMDEVQMPPNKETELQRALASLVQSQGEKIAWSPDPNAPVVLADTYGDMACWRTAAWPLPTADQMEQDTSNNRAIRLERHVTVAGVQSPHSQGVQPTSRTLQRAQDDHLDHKPATSRIRPKYPGLGDHKSGQGLYLPVKTSPDWQQSGLLERGTGQSQLHSSSWRPDPVPSSEWRAIYGVPDRNNNKPRNIGLGITNSERARDVTEGQTAVSHLSRPQRGRSSKPVSELASQPGQLERDPEPEVDVDEEHTKSITRCWNDGLWDEVKIHTGAALKQMPQSGVRTASRRLRYLQGVAASLNGDWHLALEKFLSVLKSPIKDTTRLDAGDCAAATWLGDTYAILGRRAEALLSYAIAYQGLPLQSADSDQLRHRIKAENAVCRADLDRADLEVEIDRKRRATAVNSIFSTNVMTKEAVTAFVNNMDWSAVCPVLDQSHSRAIALCELGQKLESWQEKHRLQIANSALKASAPWPVPFDPFFAMANIPRTDRATRPCDLVRMIDSKRPPKIGKAAALSRKGMNSFTCHDLRWLITTLRNCLRRLEIEWTEYSNDQDTWFETAYDSVEGGIATKHYFTITLFRLTFRSGYGAEVCSDGICSARIRRSEPNFEKGVHQEETRRIKKRIRDYLDAALNRHEAISLQGTVMPVMSINGVTGMHRRPSVSVKNHRAVAGSGSSPASPRPGSLL